MHREPDVGFDPGSPGSRPGPKAGVKPLRHPGIPQQCLFIYFLNLTVCKVCMMYVFFIFLFYFLFMIVTQREREAEAQAEGEAGSIHREPDVGLDPKSPGSRPGPKAGAKPLRHPGCPGNSNLKQKNPRVHHSIIYNSQDKEAA